MTLYAAGHGPATISVSLRTSILVIISWSPPEFHLPVLQYMITLTRVTGSGPWPRQELCPEYVDNRPTVTTTATSYSFTGFEAFSNYTVTLITRYNVSGSKVDEVTPQMMFTTLSAGKETFFHDLL